VLKMFFDDKDGVHRAECIRHDHVAVHEIISVLDLLFYKIGKVLATKKQLSEAASVDAF